MVNKEQQIKNSIIYLVPVIVSNLIPIISLPFFTRILTKEDYGVLALAQVYAIFVSGISNFGLTNIYNRNFFQYREKKESSELLYSTLFFVVTSFSIFAFLTYVFKSPISKLIIGSTKNSSILFWTYCSFGVMSLRTYYLNYFKNSENAKNFVWYTICESILSFVLSFFMVVYLRIGIIGLVWSQLIGGLVIFFILGYKFLSFLPVSFNWRILKYSLKLSYPLTPRIFFGVINNQFDKYMIGLIATVGGVGIYSIGQKVSYIIFSYMIAMHNVFSPQVYKRMFDLGDKGGESIGKYLTPYCYASIALALLIPLFSEEIISILTPKSYHGTIDIVIILSMFYGSLFFGMQPQLVFAKKTFITSLLSAGSIILNIALNIPFIIKWGAIGAAWGTLLAGVISGTVSFVVSQHYYKIKWEYKKVGTIFLIFFASSILMILLRNSDVVYTIRLMVKCTSIAIFIFIGVQIKVITVENYNIVKNILASKGNILYQRN